MLRDMLHHLETNHKKRLVLTDKIFVMSITMCTLSPDQHLLKIQIQSYNR